MSRKSSALGVVSFRNPFFSALALIGNLSSLAVLYLLLGGEFVAGAAGKATPLTLATPGFG